MCEMNEEEKVSVSVNVEGNPMWMVKSVCVLYCVWWFSVVLCECGRQPVMDGEEVYVFSVPKATRRW